MTLLVPHLAVISYSSAACQSEWFRKGDLVFKKFLTDEGILHRGIGWGRISLIRANNRIVINLKLLFLFLCNLFILNRLILFLEAVACGLVAITVAFLDPALAAEVAAE